MYSNQRQKNSLTFKRLLVLFSFIFGGLLLVNAQEKKAASKYNEGLAKLKEKDYATGFPLMEEALKFAEEEGNEKVVSLAKKNGAKAAYNLGSSKRKEKAYDEALTLFERGIELNPAYTSNYMGKAQALDGKGEKVGAVQAYIAAADLSAEAGKADRSGQLLKRAESIIGKLYSGKKYDLAIEAGKAHLALRESKNVHYYMAKSFEKQKNTPAALEHITKAVEMAEAAEGPVADKFYWAQGNILEASNKKTEALSAYKKISGEKYKANADYRIRELGGS